MNQHLQNILNIIQLDENISAEQKSTIAKSLKDADKELEITAFKLERTEKVKKTTAILLEETIDELEQKRRSVEAQNRELEIESALEKVRTAAMAMNNRTDMINICRIIMEQLTLLKVTGIRNVQTAIFDDINGIYTNYEYYRHPGKEIVTVIPFESHPVRKEFALKMMKGPGEIYEHSFKGEEIRDWIKAQEKVGEYVDPNLLEAESLDYYWYSLGPVAMGVSAYRPLHKDEIQLFIRFKNVFELSYRRYLDIEKAAAQAREAQIEAALERVRSRSMGMQKSEELKDVIKIVYQQLTLLKINIDHTGFVVDYKPGSDWHFWIADERDIPAKITHPYFESVWANQFNEAKEKGIDSFFTRLNFEEKNQFYNKLLAFVPGLPEATKEFYLKCPGLAASTVLMDNVALYIENFSGIPYTEEENITLMRFGKVFQQTYTRFLDLQKAEAQVKEAKIEAALERTRTQSMLMQHSGQLDDVLRVFHEQVLLLGIKSAFSFLWLPDEKNDRHIFWAAWAESHLNSQPGEIDSTVFKSKAINYPLDRNELATAQCLVDWKSDQPVHAYHVPPAEVDNYFAAWKELLDGVEQLKPENFQGGLNYVEAFMKYGCFGVMVESEMPEEEKKLLRRFAIEFERTYTRFLDLQKAEAQAREAQVELGLERVRARAMAMQKPEELRELIGTVFTELTKLDLALTRCLIMIYDGKTDGSTWWMANSEAPANPIGLVVQNHKSPPYLAYLKAWKNKEIKWQYILEGTVKKEWDDFLFVETELSHLPDFVIAGMKAPEQVYLNASFNSFGNLTLATLEPLSNEHFDIMLRFAKVFDLTYTRFLDLQKAEAQAREAEIELALERVRARTLAMKHSTELAETAAVLFEQFNLLGTEPERIAIEIVNEKENVFEIWATEHGGKKLNMSVKCSLDEPHVMQPMYKAWKEQKKSITIDLRGKALEEYFEYLNSQKLPVQREIFGKRRVQNVATFSKGILTIITPEPRSQETIMILERFASVFDGTYTRFLDLQKAEAQAREAKIETSLERVRSKAMAMHSTEDLAATIGVFYRELQTFSITPRRCGVGLLNRVTRDGEIFTWNTTEQGESLELVGKIKMEGHPVLNNVYEHWLNQQEYHPVLRGNEIKEYYKVVRPQMAFPDYDHDMIQYGYFFFFDEGGVYAWTGTEMGEEELKIYRRFSSVLSLTYKRYKDLQQAESLARKAEQDLVLLKEEKKRTEEALAELQVTQKQLIQSEKMASLGELTAGIAHEIQNPLNFVNNFSEVSNELIDEMVEEVEKGNYEEVKAIANDVKQNLEKINHHGKRADGIVKGMLQHSRSSSGQKEPTDINVLADEYLRLAYHGLRAKDKTFNALMKTDYDERIEKISVIPQDIGRVILNLITNAFYVVAERKKETPAGYEPTVSVGTKKMGDKVAISVKDNGKGIPPQVLDKIFQPFFTTKPTGQGTGLGLSLSYDIVKAHGGELKVQTKENEGSEFIIQLPLV